MRPGNAVSGRRRLWPGSIAGGAVLVLLIGLTLSHVVSMVVYHLDLERQLAVSVDRQLIQRMVAVVDDVATTEPAERAALAQALSWPSADITWTPDRLIKHAGLADAALAGFRRELLARLPEPRGKQPEVIVTYDAAPPEADEPHARHVLITGIRLADHSWLTFTVVRQSTMVPELTPLTLSTTVMATLVALVSIVLVRRITRPLARLAAAAKRLGTDVEAPPLDESGPDEVREAATAFNEMQARIRKLIGDRTQMLAAVSHDLKTPITRLRLRAEYVEDDGERAKMLADLDEMEAMVASTLAFLRDDAAAEQTRRLDLASVLASLAADHKDAGHAVRYGGPAHLPLRGRPLALKRAFANLIDNAVAYGGRAEVRLLATARDALVEIADEGPGIPVAAQEDVFRPFHRLDPSRSRATGGFGLGLTVARSIVRAHGGDIGLANRPTGGLAVTVSLPLGE